MIAKLIAHMIFLLNAILPLNIHIVAAVIVLLSWFATAVQKVAISLRGLLLLVWGLLLLYLTALGFETCSEVVLIFAWWDLLIIDRCVELRNLVIIYLKERIVLLASFSQFLIWRVYLWLSAGPWGKLLAFLALTINFHSIAFTIFISRDIRIALSHACLSSKLLSFLWVEGWWSSWIHF